MEKCFEFLYVWSLQWKLFRITDPFKLQTLFVGVLKNCVQNMKKKIVSNKTRCR